MTLLITKVGAPSTHTHTRKDGSTFTKVVVPFTLSVKFDSPAGFTPGVIYTLWMDPKADAQVIAGAKAFIDGIAKTRDGQDYHRACRLALANDISDFEMTAIKTDKYTSFGVERTSQKASIFLKDGAIARWEIGEVTISPETGDFDDLDLFVDTKGMALLSAPAAPSIVTEEDPF